MPEHRNDIKVDSKGSIKYISIVHPINGEYFLIQQVINKDGIIEYYTNELQEDIIGKTINWRVEIDDK